MWWTFEARCRMVHGLAGAWSRAPSVRQSARSWASSPGNVTTAPVVSNRIAKAVSNEIQHVRLVPVVFVS